MSDYTSPYGGSVRDRAGDPRDALFRANRSRVLTRLHIDSSRSMSAVMAELGELLEGIGDDLCQRSTLLASELIAQVAGRAPEWNRQEIGLSMALRAESIRLEASGPLLPASETSAHNGVADDAETDWGTFTIKRLADRWGTARGSHRYVWAEIGIPA
jgi:hypothetical protein